MGSFTTEHTRSQGLQRVSSNLPADYPLQTWSDSLEDGHYGVQLTVAQAGLPIGWYYLEVQRANNDVVGTQNRTITATSFGIVNIGNQEYKSTCSNGVWTTFVKIPNLSDFGAYLSAGGYQKLPSGLIIQWVRSSSLGSGSNTVLFPIAFPNSALLVNGTTFNALNLVRFIGLSFNATTCTFAAVTSLNGYTSSDCYILAIGY